MDVFPIFWVLAALLAMLVFDLAAVAAGVDSRDPMLDDHQR